MNWLSLRTNQMKFKALGQWPHWSKKGTEPLNNLVILTSTKPRPESLIFSFQPALKQILANDRQKP